MGKIGEYIGQTTVPKVGETGRWVQGVSASYSRDPSAETTGGTSARAKKPGL